MARYETEIEVTVKVSCGWDAIGDCPEDCSATLNGKEVELSQEQWEQIAEEMVSDMKARSEDSRYATYCDNHRND